jgi:hypothetical protein
VKFFQRNPFLILGLVVLWRVLLLVFTVQPIPANDAFGYDGGVVNFLHGGGYCNPSFALVFPISGREIYSTYPPMYQAVLFVWMKLFGASVVSAMALHLALFAISGYLTLLIIKRYFPESAGVALAILLLFGVTFDDRPEGLAYVFGLGALCLVMRQITEPRFHAGMFVAITSALFLTLYTSVIVGAYFFGVGFLACAVAWMWRRSVYWFAPFIGTAVLFVAVTASIAKWEPLWWAGFMESARQQSVMTNGLHLPHPADVIKLVRTVPVFIIALVAAPYFLIRRKAVCRQESPWTALVVGIFVMGWIMLAASVTFLVANYVNYAVFTQIILAVGLMVLVQKHLLHMERFLQVSIVACVLLVSIRAIGMTTWGVVCAWKNSYQNTQTVLQTELEPYAKSGRPVFVSSAFLYKAADIGVKNPVHSDWFFDHAHWTNHAQANALISLRPPKLVLTQFDYYRSFVLLVGQLGQETNLVQIHVRNMAALPPPDAYPSLQKVVQNISWAPVVVDLDWRTPP